MKLVILSFLCLLGILPACVLAQKTDTVITKSDTIHLAPKVKDSLPKKDSVAKKKHDPHKATIYSAILPGAGQVYNKKYWKVPIVYAAIGIPAYTYFYNKSWYNKCQYALVVTVNGTSNIDSLKAVAPELLPFVRAGDQTSIINYRNEFRKNQDYSILFVLLFWGLNIVDAAVDAHLKGFNVNDDLSMRIKPMLTPGPTLTTMTAGVSFVFDLHKTKPARKWQNLY
ncbi:MAG TPA: DUF5683 domain-containing protein [Puia sp.]|nr:DUF5683 domain-containing protein [Puia sp.]